VRDRPIRAFHLGEPGARKTVVAIGAMHGDEQESDNPLSQLRDGRPITGVNLWVVPVMNPDGYRRDDRQNARGVDLNRNFPVHWVDLDGEVESGPRPASEPETRSMMRFLTRIDPDHMVSLHQPLYGVDPRTKNPVFARRLAREMRLPIRTVTCGGVCHGTMTQWFNRRHDGDSITAELSASPSAHYLRAVAPSGLLRTIGGAR
jgi:murein tripeptide amidase MpaA